jgi:hypothetical protein
MKRRNFIKTSLAATAGVIAAPYILPSGRLFAASGMRRVNHVVFCLFAGGIRNFESVQKAEGNLMRYSFSGSENISPDIASGMTPLPQPSGSPLQSKGTLFKQFRYAQGPTGHYNGHMTAITGQYSLADINLKMPPPFPTIFEYYRKHTSPSKSALNSWWISNMLGPYPALNFSKHDLYGAMYGANYIQPSSIISAKGYTSLGNPKQFTSAEDNKIKKVREFLDNNFSKNYNPGDAGIVNVEEDSIALENFIQNSFQEAFSGAYVNPWGIGANAMNNDMYNIFFAEKILQRFKPELLVVNMQDVDIGHSNFTQYCNNLRKADYALSHLWNTIQSTPGMTNDTVLIAVPEHGRNLTHNTLLDSFGRYALDHTSDPTSREIFCLIAGPPSVIKQNNVINSVAGESIDIVPTIADLLGFRSDIPGGLLSGRVLQEALA